MIILGKVLELFRNEHGLTLLVVCSRIKEYETLNKKLTLNGAIVLQPLKSQQVDAYLDKFGNRLAGVRLLLTKDLALRELTESPLMVRIMVSSYNDKRIGELIASNNVEEQRRHLFNAYINSMFERPIRVTNPSFTKPQTLHYLSWLARKMIQHNIITYQIEAMQSPWLEEGEQRRVYKFSRLGVGLTGGLFFGLFGGLSAGLGVGLISGLISGLFGALIGGLRDEIRMVDKLRWSWRESRKGLLFGLFFGLSIELISGLLGEPREEQIEETNYPGQRLKRILYNTLLQMLIIELSVGLIGGLIGRLNDEPIVGVTVGVIVGLFFGMIVGLVVGLSVGSPLIRHYTLHLVLMWNGFLPRRL